MAFDHSWQHLNTLIFLANFLRDKSSDLPKYMVDMVSPPACMYSIDKADMLELIAPALRDCDLPPIVFNRVDD